MYRCVTTRAKAGAQAIPVSQRILFQSVKYEISIIFLVGPHILCKEVDKMERSDRRQKPTRNGQILNILAKNVRKIIQEDTGGLDGLQEIRLRTGQPVRIVCDNREKILPSEASPHIITK